MHRLAEHTRETLARGRAVVLAKIVSRRGSAPRAAGSQMVIPAEGPPLGTIGGGVLEARAIEQAQHLLTCGRSALLEVSLTWEDTATMDMICGGAVEILLDHVAPTPENRDLFARWAALLDQGAAGRLVTVVRGEGPAIERVDRFLVLGDGAVHGSAPLPQGVLESLRQGDGPAEGLQVLAAPGATVLCETAPRVVSALFCGAGHVAQAAAALAARVGFRVEVLDDRGAFANAARFPAAAAVHVVPDFSRALSVRPADDATFVVILTRGHLHDRTVLAQALRSPAPYIGMIGSRRKRDAIYARLREEGFGEADLARVHAPIGLDIGAETPEELAVSIVGELIRVRASRAT